MTAREVRRWLAVALIFFGIRLGYAAGEFTARYEAGETWRTAAFRWSHGHVGLHFGFTFGLVFVSGLVARVVIKVLEESVE